MLLEGNNQKEKGVTAWAAKNAVGILMAVLIAMFISGKTENYVKNPSSFGFH